MVVVKAPMLVENTTFIHLNMPTHPTKIAKEKDELWVNDMSSSLNSINYGFLIWDLTNFNLVHDFPIPFNYTHNYLTTFNCMQLHHYQIQISKPMFNAFLQMSH